MALEFTPTISAIGPYRTEDEAYLAGQEEAMRQESLGNTFRDLRTARNELDPNQFDAIIEYDDYGPSTTEETYEPTPSVKSSPPYALIAVGILTGGLILGGVLYFGSKKGKRS